MSIQNWPYTNIHDLNLDWILQEIKKAVATVEAESSQVRANTNSITNINNQIKNIEAEIAELEMNPFEIHYGGAWNIEMTYDKDTLVFNPNNGNSYISIQDVPAGIEIGNDTYWQITAQFSAQLEALYNMIAELQTTSQPTELLEFAYYTPMHYAKIDGVNSQGSCIATINGTNYVFYVDFAGNNELSKVIKRNANTGIITAQSSNINLGHGNGLAYCADNNEIYIARNGGTPAPANPNRIEIFDADTLTYKGYRDFNHECNNIAAFNNKIYIMTSVLALTIYEYTTSWNLLSSVAIDTGDRRLNGFCADNNYFYFATLRNSTTYSSKDGIAVYYKNGDIKGFVNFPFLAEIEDISIYDNGLYATLNLSPNMAGGKLKIFDIPTIENRAEYVELTTALRTTTQNITYANASYDGFVCNGSASAPFPELGYALDVSLIAGFSVYDLTITGDFSSNAIQIQYPNKARLINLHGTGIVGGMIFYNCHEVRINDLTITHQNLPAQFPGAINSYGSEITITNCTIQSSTTGVYAYNGLISINNCNLTTVGRCLYSSNNSKISVAASTLTTDSNAYFQQRKSGVISIEAAPLEFINKGYDTDNRDTLQGVVVLQANDDISTIRAGCKLIATSTAIANTIQNMPEGKTGVFEINAFITVNNVVHLIAYYADNTIYTSTIVNNTMLPWTQL